MLRPSVFYVPPFPLAVPTPPEFRWRVALEVKRKGMDPERIEQRFSAERQALGPNAWSTRAAQRTRIP